MSTIDLKEAKEELSTMLDKIFTDHTKYVGKIYQNLCKLYNRSTVDLSLALIFELSTQHPPVEYDYLGLVPSLLKVKLNGRSIIVEEGSLFITEEALVEGGYLRSPVGSLLVFFFEYFLHVYHDTITKFPATLEVIEELNNLLQFLIVSYTTHLQVYIKNLQVSPQ